MDGLKRPPGARHGDAVYLTCVFRGRPVLWWDGGGFGPMADRYVLYRWTAERIAAWFHDEVDDDGGQLFIGRVPDPTRVWAKPELESAPASEPESEPKPEPEPEPTGERPTDYTVFLGYRPDPRTDRRLWWCGTCFGPKTERVAVGYDTSLAVERMTFGYGPDGGSIVAKNGQFTREETDETSLRFKQYQKRRIDENPPARGNTDRTDVVDLCECGTWTTSILCHTCRGRWNHEPRATSYGRPPETRFNKFMKKIANLSLGERCKDRITSED